MHGKGSEKTKHVAAILVSEQLFRTDGVLAGYGMEQGLDEGSSSSSNLRVRVGAAYLRLGKDKHNLFGFSP